MKNLFWFSMGALFFVACSTAEIIFPYEFYHVTPSQVWDFPNAKLLGSSPDKDLPFSECKPKRQNEEGKWVQECVIVFYKELGELIKDYKETKQSLIDCQKGVVSGLSKNGNNYVLRLGDGSIARVITLD